MSRHAMVCDENKERREQLTSILESLHFRVMPCVNQRDGVQALGMDPAIAFIHLDTGKTMETADLEALRRVKKQNGTLFFLMAEKEEMLENAASLGLGFDGFLLEAFSLASVRQTLKVSHAL